MTKEPLLLATSNPGKIREIRQILAGLPYTILTRDEVKLKEGDKAVIESGKTFAENASRKARALGQQTGILTLADDSGLEIDALAGRPGVRSARFAKGSDRERRNKVLRLLAGVPKHRRTARFLAAIAIFDPADNRVHLFEGQVEGRIGRTPQGRGGFGYDPIFYSPELGKTFGLASANDKNRVSHRARALREAIAFLERRAREGMNWPQPPL